MIKISVIIPVFNSEEFINECITSVLKQSLKQIEVICVDDGSTDASTKRIKSLQVYDNRIVLFQQPHRCAAYARNYGLKMATGEYVSFLDADDFYVSSFALEEMFINSKKNNAMICAADLIYKDMAYDYSAPFNTIDVSISINKVKAGNAEWMNFSDIQDDFLFTRYIFNREMLLNNNITFPLYRRYEDPPFLLKTMCLEEKFLYIPITLYCYRIHYKPKRLNKGQLLDALCGIFDNMILAFNHNYVLLYNKLIHRLSVAYREHIIKYWSDEVSIIIMRIVDFHAKTHSGENLLLKLISTWSDSYNNFKYMFPYHLFKKNDKVIICGSGTVYRSFLYQLATMPQFIQIIVSIDFTDNTYENLKKIISQTEYDYILIATKNMHQFNEIKKAFNLLGVDDKKIKWDGINYIRDNFYENIIYNLNP